MILGVSDARWSSMRRLRLGSLKHMKERDNQNQEPFLQHDLVASCPIHLWRLELEVRQQPSKSVEHAGAFGLW